MKSPTSQRGLSTLAILVIIMLVGFFATCAVKLIPVYIAGGTISSTIQSSIDNGEFNGKSNGEIRSSLSKHFQTNQIKSLQPKDIQISREAGVVSIDARHEQRVSLFGSIDVVVKFDDMLFDFRDAR